MKLGQQVKKLRKSLKLTQKEFASRVLGKGGYTYIGKIEKGHQYPSLKLLERTARAYGVPVLYFFLEDGGAEVEDFNRYLEVCLNVKESIRRWMVRKLLTLGEELEQGIDEVIEEAFREARGSERVERLGEEGKGKICSDLLAVCIKHWGACRGICPDFVPVVPSVESIESLACQFRRIVYLSTEELKNLVHRTDISQSLPWQELLKKSFAEDEENSQENNPGEGQTAEEILPAPLPFCDYPMIAGRM